MLYEVSVSPKPGLVDRINCGAHQDMDFLICGQCRCHCSFSGNCAGRDMTILREVWLSVGAAQRLGLDAEAAMYDATGGVNNTLRV